MGEHPPALSASTDNTSGLGAKSAFAWSLTPTAHPAGRRLSDLERAACFAEENPGALPLLLFPALGLGRMPVEVPATLLALPGVWSCRRSVTLPRRSSPFRRSMSAMMAFCASTSISPR